PVVFTGVIGDRWFCGSDFFRLDWEKNTLVRESPTLDDWLRFRRFFWFDPPDPSKSEPFQTLLFSTQPEHWTLLPPHWRSLQGDVEHNKSFLVVWDQSRLFLGDISAEQNFGEGLPKIVVGTKPDSSHHAPSGRGDAPDYLVALCQTRKVPAPSIAPERVESEETLQLFWKAMANKHQTHFSWTLSLDRARAFSKQLLGNPIARTSRPVTRDP
ncbi:MAG: hypothetical protein KGR69_09430, partial [Verrucomicrobia bacterium]|nr:hypothetical protein [Verrucomicrobiota bacterium]